MKLSGNSIASEPSRGLAIASAAGTDGPGTAETHPPARPGSNAVPPSSWSPEEIAERFGDLARRPILILGWGEIGLATRLAALGASVTLVDAQERTLTPAEAGDGRDVPNVQLANIGLRRFPAQLQGCFDIVLAANVLDRNYDAALVLANLRAALPEGGQVLCRMRNGFAIRNVLSDAFARIVGVALLPPEALYLFGKGPPRVYYRSWQQVLALLAFNGLRLEALLSSASDRDLESTIVHLKNDIRQLKRELTPNNFAGTQQFKPIRIACRDYIEQLESDMLSMPASELHHYYRARSWEFVLRAAS